MKAYITKYALSLGIQEVDDAEVYEAAPQMITVSSLGLSTYFHGEGREWHRDKPSAIKRAKLMRTKAIESLHKRIIKLEAMRFE